MRLFPSFDFHRAPISRQDFREDAFLAHEAECRLHNSAYSSLRDVHCTCHHGVLIITGRVPSYYVKQVAQSLVRTLDQVDEVVNDLEVR
jgi:hypothetical protein